MCHDDESRPPSPPVVGEVAEHGLLTLTGGDGNTFAAYSARPAEPNGRNVVILPDVRGLHPYYEHLAIRFAEAGFTAVAMDYFGRSLGVGERDDELDWKTEVDKLQPGDVESDAAAAAEYLRGVADGPVFSVGFCMGGSQSWRLSASDIDLAGCMGFYGRPSLVASVEERMHHPVLMLVAGADMTPQEEFHALDHRLAERGVDHEMYVYEDAPHSFFDRSFGDWKAACDDAWLRMLAFTQRLA